MTSAGQVARMVLTPTRLVGRGPFDDENYITSRKVAFLDVEGYTVRMKAPRSTIFGFGAQFGDVELKNTNHFIYYFYKCIRQLTTRTFEKDQCCLLDI